MPAQASITQWFDTEMIQVASGDVLQMRNEKFAAILDEINAKVQKGRLAKILPWLAVAAFVVAAFMLDIMFLVLIVLALPLWLVGRWLDSYRRVTVLLYDLDENVADAFAGVTEAFDLMMSSSGRWRIEAGTAVQDLATWKRNSGASHLVQKKPDFPRLQPAGRHY